MLKCRDCGAVFEEDEATRRRAEPEDGVPYYETIRECPWCGGYTDEYEEMDETTMGQLNPDEPINYHIENDGTYETAENKDLGAEKR